MGFFCFILIASFFVVSNSTFDVETEKLIDHLVENLFMANNRIPGAGLSVVRNGTVLMSKGYGLKNVSAGLAADDNTLFSIGAITKTFIAILVVKTLNELYPQRGAAALDVPLAQLIPSTVNFTLSDRYRAEQTTFRDILSHRTCLLNGQIDLIYGSIPSASEYTLYLPQVCEFRNGFEYNNNLYSLAGEMIAAIKGTTLQDMLMSLIQDIGMVNTTYIDFDGSFESNPDMSQPYILKNGTLVEFDIFQIRKVHLSLGSTGILSTPNDMAKYMNFYANQGRVGDRQIVPANVMSWLYVVLNPFEFEGARTKENSIVSGELGPTQGFFSALYDGWSLVRHTGYSPPFHCDIRLFLATRIGVFICTNGAGFIRNFPVHANVISNIFDLVRRNNQSLADILSLEEDVGKPFMDHQQIRGVYGHPHDGDLTVSYAPGTSNTTLQLYFSEWAYGRLEPIEGSNTTFSVEWDTTIMDHFYSYPSAVPNFWIDFGIADTVLFWIGELDLYDEFEFVKNATIDTFPIIPWTPDSCGPE